MIRLFLSVFQRVFKTWRIIKYFESLTSCFNRVSIGLLLRAVVLGRLVLLGLLDVDRRIVAARPGSLLLIFLLFVFG